MSEDLWKSRITRHGEASPEELVANPFNWRMHIKPQNNVMMGVLDEIGYIQSIIVNERTGHIVDGHSRVTLAVQRGEKSIPVTYVDLDENEERVALLTFDPLAMMAIKDQQMVDELVMQTEVEDAHVRELLEKAASSQEWQPPTRIAGEKIAGAEADLRQHYEDLANKKQKRMVAVTCPNCSGVFNVVAHDLNPN